MLESVDTDAGLRLYTPALGSLDRIVPPEGVVCSGVAIPGGTAIGLQSYATHRDPEVWSDPFGQSSATCSNMTDNPLKNSNPNDG